MHKRNRVLSLLSSRKPATEVDKKEILSYCREKRMNVYFHRDSESFEPITYGEFLQWYELQHYNVEEVITDKDGTIYLITDFVAGESVSGAYVNHIGEFCVDPKPLPVAEAHKKGSGEERLELQRAMNKSGYIWNPYKKAVMPHIQPDNNDYITLWVLADLVGMGIYKEVNENGDLVLYCFADNKGNLKIDDHFVLGPAIDYAVRGARPTDRSDIIEKLHHANLYWHGKLKRFEPLNLRQRPGGEYYYINSAGRIRSTVETGRSIDHDRYKFGNYFRTLKDADLFKKKMVHFRNEQLTGKLSLHD